MEKLRAANPPEEVMKVAQRELKRLAKGGEQQPGHAAARTYLEILADLPWSRFSHQARADALAAAAAAASQPGPAGNGSRGPAPSAAAAASADAGAAGAGPGDGAGTGVHGTGSEAGGDAPDGQGPGGQEEEGAAEAERQQQAALKRVPRAALSTSAVPLREPPTSLAGVRALLDEAHYGLDKVKERIVQYVAVRRLRGWDARAPILCFIGPPGVGKTTLARSVADVLGRPVQRISLGGVRDEAEIRGHRRTYVGAMPGRVLTALRRAGVADPVLLLDEVDKLGRDSRGDPAAALLEVLDPEQNHAFVDTYLALPFDLSKVVFVATANRGSEIPAPLLDRMEVIQLGGYTLEEKAHIAERHLVPKLLEQHGVPAHQLVVPQATLSFIIQGYTREAGVRELGRCLASILRHVAVQIVSAADEEKHLQAGARPDDVSSGVTGDGQGWDGASRQGPGVGGVGDEDRGPFGGGPGLGDVDEDDAADAAAMTALFGERGMNGALDHADGDDEHGQQQQQPQHRHVRHGGHAHGSTSAGSHHQHGDGHEQGYWDWLMGLFGLGGRAPHPHALLLPSGTAASPGVPSAPSRGHGVLDRAARNSTGRDARRHGALLPADSDAEEEEEAEEIGREEEDGHTSHGCSGSSSSSRGDRRAGRLPRKGEGGSLLDLDSGFADAATGTGSAIPCRAPGPSRAEVHTSPHRRFFQQQGAAARRLRGVARQIAAGDRAAAAAAAEAMPPPSGRDMGARECESQGAGLDAASSGDYAQRPPGPEGEDRRRRGCLDGTPLPAAPGTRSPTGHMGLFAGSRQGLHGAPRGCHITPAHARALPAAPLATAAGLQLSSMSPYPPQYPSPAQGLDTSSPALVVDEGMVELVLGPVKFSGAEAAERVTTPGSAAGLVWTAAGGLVQYVECAAVGCGQGSAQGRVTLTGSMGDVLQESSHIALSWVRSHAPELGIQPSAARSTDVHVHLPTGAVPKDGPSAGVTLACALVSLLTGRCCRADTAMTGELSLRGLVLPVGGVKEKLLAAHAAGLKRVLIPRRNARDAEADVPQKVQDSLRIIPCATIEDVLREAFDPPLLLLPRSKL